MLKYIGGEVLNAWEELSSAQTDGIVNGHHYSRCRASRFYERITLLVVKVSRVLFPQYPPDHFALGSPRHYINP